MLNTRNSLIIKQITVQHYFASHLQLFPFNINSLCVLNILSLDKLPLYVDFQILDYTYNYGKMLVHME